jgi:cbb3-type cytochrome oxidase maturation protein
MTALAWLIPCALLLGLLGLAAFLWSLNSGQFEDLDGAGWRALQDDEGVRLSGSDTTATASGESAGAVR